MLVFASSCKKDDDDNNITVSNFTDSRDANVYIFVNIGNQIWMTENLRYLPSVVGPYTDSQTTPYYYVYGYDETNIGDAKATANYNTYGVLYNWEAAKAAWPVGWHLPSDAEWTELTDFLGGESVAGGKLKEIGTTYWSSPNTGATNETYFSALPGGLRNGDETTGYVSVYGYWWSTTETHATRANNRKMSNNNSYVARNNTSKELGFSVRCVRD